MLTPEALAKIRRLEISSTKLVEEIFSGKYLSVFKGRGIEFSDIRGYQWGDDIRAMHWKAMARFAGEAFIKRFTDERQLTVVLAVDYSGSLNFGSKARAKKELLQDVAGLIAYLTLKNKDRVGLLAFTDQIELFLPPKSGRTHALRILRELVSFRATSTKTDLPAALTFIAKTIKKRAILFLISDFLGQGFEKQLSILAKKHDCIAISIEDPLETSLPTLPAKLAIEDSEDPDSELVVDLRQQAFLQAISENIKETKETLQTTFASYGIDHWKLSTDKNFVDALVKFFTAREAKALRS